MRIVPSLAVLGAALAVASGAVAQTAAPQFSAERLSQDIRILSADDFEGRGIATPAEQKVVDYLSRGYAEAGFQPGGDLQPDGSRLWTQAVGLNRFQVSTPRAGSGSATGPCPWPRANRSSCPPACPPPETARAMSC